METCTRIPFAMCAEQACTTQPNIKVQRIYGNVETMCHDAKENVLIRAASNNDTFDRKCTFNTFEQSSCEICLDKNNCILRVWRNTQVEVDPIKRAIVLKKGTLLCRQRDGYNLWHVKVADYSTEPVGTIRICLHGHLDFSPRVSIQVLESNKPLIVKDLDTGLAVKHPVVYETFVSTSTPNWQERPKGMAPIPNSNVRPFVISAAEQNKIDWPIDIPVPRRAPMRGRRPIEVIPSIPTEVAVHSDTNLTETLPDSASEILALNHMLTKSWSPPMLAKGNLKVEIECEVGSSAKLALFTSKSSGYREFDLSALRSMQQCARNWKHTGSRILVKSEFSVIEKEVRSSSFDLPIIGK